MVALGSLTNFTSKVQAFLSSEIVRTTAIAILVLIIGMLVIWIVFFQVRRLSERNVISAMAAERIKKATLTTVLFLVLLAELYIATSNMILLALVLIALAVVLGASWRIISMMIAHYALVLSKHIAQGEYVEVMGVRGRVKNIGLIHTVIRCDDNSQLLIPNTKLLEETVKHVGTERTATLRLTLSIASPNDLEEIEEKVDAVLRERFKHSPRSGEYSMHIEKLESNRVSCILKTKYLGAEVREEVISTLLKELYQGLSEYEPTIEIVSVD